MAAPAFESFDHPVPEWHTFRKTAKQVKQTRLMLDHEVSLFEGGARSGKTFNVIRQMVARGLRTPSNHLAARSHLKHARDALGRDTIPNVFKLCFPKLPFVHNKSDNFFSFPTTRDGGEESFIWLGGIEDNPDRALGREYSSFLADEASMISFDTFTTLRTRVAETSGLKLRTYLCQNPTVKTWWTYRVFHEGMTPEREPVDWDTAWLSMNPLDNRANLDPRYIRMLSKLPKRKRQRFFQGLYLMEIEGALWDEIVLNIARLKEPGKIQRTVVAVDPSVSSTEDADECGIVVCSKDDSHKDGGGIVHGDFSAQLSPEKWARRVVDLYHQYKANVVVAEVNQGGDLVESVIHNVDPTIPVEKVHASKSKFARAEPVAQLYEQGQERIHHAGLFAELEEELTTYVARDAKYSPNRLDALVWGFTYLLGDPSSGFDIAGF